MFYLGLYQGLKPGIHSLRYNTPHLQENTKQIKVNKVVQHQKTTANG